MATLTEKHFLGKLCKQGHSHRGTGKSLRYSGGMRQCVACHKICTERWRKTHPKQHRSRKASDQSWMGYVARFLRSRSRKNELPFDLTGDFLQELWQQQTGKCHWLQVPLELRAARNCPYKATLDRLVPAAGYVKGNVVWASRFANVGRSDYPEDAFRGFVQQLRSVLAGTETESCTTRS